jgi:hypothetical protein
VVAENVNRQKMEFFIYMDESKKLGEGSFGVVRPAIINNDSNELFAVKIIPYNNEDRREKVEK